MDCFTIYPAESRSTTLFFLSSSFLAATPFLSAIPLCRNLVKTVSDWVHVARRPSIPLTALIGFFHLALTVRPTSSLCYELPRRIVELTTCTRIHLLGFKIAFRVGGRKNADTWQLCLDSTSSKIKYSGFSSRDEFYIIHIARFLQDL